MRLPDGVRLTRRFMVLDPTSALFAVADAHGAGGMAEGTYQLVLQYPRRVLLPQGVGPATTLAEVGLLAGQQEVVFLEPLPPAK